MRNPSGGDATGREVGVDVAGGIVGVGLTGKTLGAGVTVRIGSCVAVGVDPREGVPQPTTSRMINRVQKIRCNVNFVVMANLLTPIFWRGRYL